MQESTTRRIYDWQCHFYDTIGWFLALPRQRTAIGQMNIKADDRILDVGIGTGLALHAYPRDAHVVGIDLSTGMLRRAGRRADRLGHTDTHLVRGNALRLPFADDSFDKIVVTHVVTVVSDPIGLIEEVRRVGKPGCRIVIINHFHSSAFLWGTCERLMNPICQKLGWRSDLCFYDFLKETALKVDFRYRINPIDVWQTVFATNDGTPSLAT